MGLYAPSAAAWNYYPIQGRNSDQCRSSRHQTSVTAEPVMHCTRLPLTLWFWSHFRRASDKFNKAIEEIDKTIATLQKVKED